MLKEFENWLKQNGLEKSTKHYLSGIKTISKIALDLKIINKNLYDIIDAKEFEIAKEKIFSNKEFISKKKTGHYMYSAALNGYQRFLNTKENKQDDKNYDLLIEENEQFEKINNGSVTGYTKDELKEIENKNYKYTPRIDNSKNKVLREKTDPKLKATRIELSNYNCEINHNHKTFTNAAGTHQYLECHHIIPISAQKDFPNVKLDSLFNLISLCPICHAEVHYANLKEKGEIFSKMYELRKDEMLEHGFGLKEINEIFNKYYK